ncbi:MAG: methionine adenosyltransferase [Promethearchaeota archaeon]|nr:MAG: methionine adenosyltransferase [Candidatus Lokiarchaeota archaeon]
MLKVSNSNRTPVEKSNTPEMVERKGKGHPDSVADECAEEISRRLSKYYQATFGQVLHHNVDKLALIGGVASPEFGGGEIIEPIKILAIGRATEQVLVGEKLRKVPVGMIAIKSCRDIIKNTFRALDPDLDVQYDYALRPGSIDLVGVFDNKQASIPLANDTSFGVGFAPYSDAEKLTLETELYLNSDKFKDICPASGEDIKVMTNRIGNEVNLTVCNAIISKYVNDKSEYANVVDRINKAILDLSAKIVPNKNVNVGVNVGDDLDKGVMFLTITGTSAENGDDGIVGRGNRTSGLITPTHSRPQSLEAAAGKNPINHVGKIYSIMAQLISKSIYEKAGGDAVEVYVRLQSQIGHPINNPWLGDIEIIPADNVNFSSLEKLSIETAQEYLDDYLGVRKQIIDGHHQIW